MMLNDGIRNMLSSLFTCLFPRHVRAVLVLRVRSVQPVAL